MKSVPSVACGVAVACLAWCSPALAAYDDLEKTWQAFYRTGLDTAAALPVENLTYQKDAMTLVLKKGILVPMQPIEGEITGAMFVGEGTATLTAPSSMDTWFLKKYYGADKFSEDFTRLYMRFTDDTEMKFPKPTPGVDQAAVSSRMSEIEDSFKDRQGVADGWISSDFDMDLDFLDQRVGGIRGHEYFYAQFQTSKWGWVTFLLNYGDIIEVHLGHDRTVGVYRDYLPWANFHRQIDYNQGRYLILPSSDSKDTVDVLRNDMTISIPTTKTVEIETRLTVSPRVDALGAVRFDLLNQYGAVNWRDTGRPITVLGVTDASGAALPFLHKRNQILVRAPRPLPKGQPFEIRMKIKEDTIIQVTAESYALLNTYPWYPQHGYVGGRFAFNFNIEVQRPLTPVGSGKVVREWENKETKMDGVELKMDERVQLASVLFGRFQKQTATYHSPVSNRDINFSVHAFPTMTFTITDQAILELLGERSPITVTFTVPPGKMKGILEETQAIVKFYEQLYGAFPFSDLHVAQMYPGSGFGQAPPALVQLDGLAFRSQAELESDFLHEFLSHEVGHQYWGHNIGWANDRDTWLSEAYAEYSAGLYVQALMGEKRFQQKMTDWRKNARQADPFAPIALCTQLSGDNAGKYYTQLIYNKGPLVVHMMRTQLGNENFQTAMKNLHSKYRGQNITTEMLAIELSNVTKYNWDYFFDQWFRGVGIPEVHYKWKTTPKDGKFLFEITFNQKDTENFKKFVAVPVVWKGKGKEEARKEFPFFQQGQTLQAMLPFDPREVAIDPDHNLLADFVLDK